MITDRFLWAGTLVLNQRHRRRLHFTTRPRRTDVRRICAGGVAEAEMSETAKGAAQDAADDKAYALSRRI
jgi:hypothetical protein